MMDFDTENRLRHYRLSCQRGVKWLLSQMDESGAIGPVNSRLYYYRVPWTMALLGEVDAANQSLDWIRDNMLSENGCFEGVSPQGVYQERYGSYPLACLLTGAQMMQRFDIVYPGTESLLRWQDPVSGGAYNSLDDTTDDAEQELFPTAQMGMTFISLGRVEEAILAGNWMESQWQQQPDSAQCLYHVYSRAKGVITDVPAGKDALYCTRKDDPWQHHFNGGIAAAFLSQLYLATGVQTWLDLARAYQEFSMSTDAVQFRSMQTCKSSWGSGLLYLATRDRTYFYWTRRMGDWFTSHQYADGHWENTHYWNPVPTEADNIEITAEFVMHLGYIISNLALPRRSAT